MQDNMLEKAQLVGLANLSWQEVVELLTTPACAKKVEDLKVGPTFLAQASLANLRKQGFAKKEAQVLWTATRLGLFDRFTTNPSKITGSFSAQEIIRPYLGSLGHEEFWVICLDRSNCVLAVRRISSGGVSGTFVDPKIVFSEALGLRASALILAHNHPSGNLKPSKADRQLTQKIQDGAKLLEIRVWDHLIIAGGSYTSFADEGYL